MRSSILVAIALAGCGADARSPLPLPAGEPYLTVMSYNVNFGLAGDPEGEAAIRAGDADLVVLQETTAAWERALRAGLGDRYPHMMFRHCCGAGGLAILSRYAIDASEYLPKVGDGWFPAWRVVVTTPLGPIQVLAVHLRPPLSEHGSVVTGYFTTPGVRRAEIEAFVAHLDEDLPTLVVGDFNEPADGSAVRFLAERGLRSALPEFHPGADTWGWQTSLGTVRSQLDHIVYDPKLAALDARVIHAGRSDHHPVVAIFKRGE
jgi:endonuclease/exonuclease/phosphatase (EEP) superfamily protein YafD